MDRNNTVSGSAAHPIGSHSLSDNTMENVVAQLGEQLDSSDSDTEDSLDGKDLEEDLMAFDSEQAALIRKNLL